MSENSRRFLKALFGFDAAMQRAGDNWSNQSPCEEWTASDVVAHNIAMNTMIAGFTRGIGANGVEETGITDPATEWAASFSAVQEALDADGALQSVTMTPWGELPVEKFLGFVWVDPLIHTWDLSMATGQAPVLNQALVADGYKRLERAGESLVGPGRFKAAVAADGDMSMLDKFVAISGRDPRWVPGA